MNIFLLIISEIVVKWLAGYPVLLVELFFLVLTHLIPINILKGFCHYFPDAAYLLVCFLVSGE